MKKKLETNPVAIIVGGIEASLTWMFVFAVVAVLGLVGTVTFAMLWWLG